MDPSALGKLLLVAGGVLALAGAVLVAAAWLGFGRLPGDLSFRIGGVKVYLPLATSIVISVILTLVLSYLARR